MIPTLEPFIGFPSVSELTCGPASPITAESGMIDVWSCALEASGSVLASCRDCLNEEERTRADRFIRPEDRTRFTVAHGALRFVLARYVNVKPAVLCFENGPRGKPALANQQSGYELHFNLSHSHGRMLVTVARQEVGVDLEKVRAKVAVLKLAERFYTPWEYQWVRDQEVTEQAGEFYRLWVAKEALLKGQGIGIPSLQQCEILTSVTPPPVRIHSTASAGIADGWTIQWLNCGPLWRAAVSTAGTDWSLRVFPSDGN